MADIADLLKSSLYTFIFIYIWLYVRPYVGDAYHLAFANKSKELGSKHFYFASEEL